jgi:hypothetical protein
MVSRLIPSCAVTLTLPAHRSYLRPPPHPPHSSAQLDRDTARLAAMAGELEEVQAALAAHKDARARSETERRVEAAVEVRE